MENQQEQKRCCPSCGNCCRCNCCIGSINYNLDHLTSDTQILPPIQNNLATDSVLGKPETLYPTNNELITFGNISYGKKLNLNELSKLNSYKLNVKNISFSDNQSLMLIERIENDGRIGETLVFGYGSNENGELGLDYNPAEKNSYNNWINIPLKQKIGQRSLIFWDTFDFMVDNVYTGDKFSLITIIYLRDGTLGLYRFQIRKDDKFSLLNGESDESKNCVHMEKFNTLYNGGIKQVAVFGDRILILTHMNYLYIKGTLYDMGNAVDYVLYKKFQIKILSLNNGINNCLLLGQDNIIYAVGHNDYSEFGIKEEDLINASSNKNKTVIDFKEGEVFENKFFQTNNLVIKKISTGARHSLVLCNNGQLYCFGDNSDGQCCGLEKIVNVPTLIRFDDCDEVIVDIKAGFNHSIAKGKTGKIYVWGDSAWDKLGFKETRVDQYDPVEVSDLKIRNVIRMFAGPKQSAFFISGGIPI